MYVIADERRKARKPQRCNMCCRAVDPGETYTHQRVVDGGDIWTWRCCAHCGAMIDILDLHSWTDEGVTAYTAAEYEPQTIAEARIIVGWKTGWRRKDGTLREVPRETKGV